MRDRFGSRFRFAFACPLVLLAAVSTPVDAKKPPPPPECVAIPGGEELFRPGRLLLLGELHGTRESPTFAVDAVCNAAATKLETVLGLELSPAGQAEVDRYLDSAGSEEDRRKLVFDRLWQSSYQDGRKSRAVLGAIERVRALRSRGLPMSVLLFDAPGGRGGQQRERDMAANLLKSIEAKPKAMHIVLTGNRHSRVYKGSRNRADYAPMGSLLKEAIGAKRVTALDAGHQGGSAWVCTPDCGITELGASVPASPERAMGSVELDEESRPSGHDGWYFVGSISASPPANGDYCRKERQALHETLEWGYDAFDQSLGEGWRELAELQCRLEAAELIEEYLAKHADLTAFQKRVLHFHAGQLFSFEDDYASALPHFERSIHAEEAPDTTFQWNAYVRATLAFLRGDAKALQEQRAIVAKSDPMGGSVPNLNVVDGMIENLGRPYRFAYGSKSRRARKDSDAAPAAAAEASVAELPPTGSTERWQGHWQAWEYGAKSWTLRVDGRKFYGLVGEDDWYHGSLTVRPDTSPAQIDFHIEDCRCNYKGRTSEGIFVWEGETIKLATPQPGSRRPTIFDENNGEMVTLTRIEE